MVDVAEAIFIDLTGLDEDERVLVKYMLATSRAPRAPFLMVVVDTWEALEAILEHGSDVRIILRTCKAAAPYVSPAAQAPAAALRAAEAFKHFQGGAAIFPIVRKGGDKKCYPRCLSALHSLSARLPPVARMGVGNYRIMVDNLMLAMQPPEDGSAVLYVLMPGECAAASCEPDSPECYGCSPAIHACAQLGSAKDANMLYIFDATPDVCTSLFARWALFRTWTKEETQALRVGGNWWLQEGGATLTSGELMSEEQKQGGCSRLFIVTVMLVCAPSELVAPLKRDWSAAGEQALLDGRCAFQRTLYLDVAGEKAQVAVTEAMPCDVPPHPSHLPVAQLASRQAGSWRPVLCNPA